jgi:hypothetical protein
MTAPTLAQMAVACDQAAIHADYVDLGSRGARLRAAAVLIRAVERGEWVHKPCKLTDDHCECWYRGGKCCHCSAASKEPEPEITRGRECS